MSVVFPVCFGCNRHQSSTLLKCTVVLHLLFIRSLNQIEIYPILILSLVIVVSVYSVVIFIAILKLNVKVVS